MRRARRGRRPGARPPTSWRAAGDVRPRAAPEQTARDTLEPVIGVPRATPDLVGHLAGEADALLRDRLGDRRAAGDLVDRLPQLRAVEDLRHADGERAAGDDVGDQPFD